MENHIFRHEKARLSGESRAKDMAEREGFEPSKGCYSFNGLANRRLQPLGHLSVYARLSGNQLKGT
jgi:hypothetical protein